MNTFRLLLISGLLFLTACSDSSSPSGQDLAHIYFYDAEQDANLLSCVNYQQYCTVEQLSFIAAETPNPTINEIMQRVVVSHDWMGERFKDLLGELPSDIHILLGSVTAIVIADNIRPSFYWTGSGAIYLDPADLWLTNEEKATVQVEEDYRSSFGSDLQYRFFHRFVRENEPAYYYYSLSGTEERNLEDIVLPMASLLFHELAHANDFVPQHKIASLQSQDKIWRAINDLSEFQTQYALDAEAPLASSDLFTHAQIRYQGADASDAALLQTGADLGDLMEQEGANHLYAYSSKAEDVAMLFQASMLKKHYNVDMDSAFVGNPTDDNLTCADYIISWGMRNKIAYRNTKERAKFVAESLLPATDFDAFFINLNNSQFFPDQIDWCNVTLSDITSKTLRSPKASSFILHPQHGVIINLNGQ